MSNPFLVQIPFAYQGNKNQIQIERQQSQDEEDATYKLGFPPVTMAKEELGGKPPKGLDFNGIFYELSSPIAHYCKGGRIYFDQEYADAIEGYPKGHIVASNDYSKDFISLVDGNTLNPNTGNITGYWAIYSGQGSVPTATATISGTTKLVNVLTSTAVDSALTAAQGKVLEDTKVKYQVITTVQNANNLNSQGVYIINVLSGANFPINAFGVLTVSANALSGTAFRCYQTFQSDLSNDVYTRSWNGYIWSIWGKMVTSDSIFGIDQEYYNMDSQRQLGVDYINDTKKPIEVSISCADTNNQSPIVTIYVNGINILDNRYDTSDNFGSFSHSFTVPSGKSYKISCTTQVTYRWSELR